VRARTEAPPSNLTTLLQAGNTTSGAVNVCVRVFVFV